MRFVTFFYEGRTSWGRVDGDDILDLGGLPGAPATLKDAVAQERLDFDGPAARLPRNNVTLLPVIPDPGKILCVGHNYESHRKETGRAKVSYPSIFTRFADTLIADGAPLVMPKASADFDFEAELAVVIGKGGRNIPETDAMAHVAGYACFNDGSLRDWQWHTTQFTPGKNFPGTAPFGPELVTPDEISDLDSVLVQSILNGDVMQEAPVAHMIFPIPVIIAYVSQFTPLSPGDVIATGTPGGVGAKRTPPVWMRPGDEIEIRISGVGSLKNTVRAET
ncbi:MAG: 5-oxopent-3-ene-1,2,5-tricarboxylate decarboxylase [Maritimibacter sp.]|nr:5-oxopent-3-ene-1,2,5-tricarboxylate decarboxylase [Maritimibacter sp.]